MLRPKSKLIGCGTSGAFGTDADVGVLPILAGAAVSAWLAETLVDVGLAQSASVPGVAVAAEGSQAVHAGAVVAGVRVALVDFGVAVPAGVT